jgi:hypothetical protein
MRIGSIPWALLAVAPSAMATIVASQTFDSGTLNPEIGLFVWHPYNCCTPLDGCAIVCGDGRPSSIVAQGGVSRAGGYAAKLSCDVSDGRIAGANHRAKFQVGDAVTAPAERWYGWAIYIPADWQDTNAFHILTDWHVNSVMQPLQLNANTNFIQWEHYDQNQSQHVLWKAYDFDTMKGKWTDWIVHAYWSTDTSGNASTNGFFQIWRKIGSAAWVQILNWHPGQGDATVIPGGGYPYWDIGLNYTNSESRIIYADEAKMGDAHSSFAEVAPPSGAAPTIPKGLRITR